MKIYKAIKHPIFALKILGTKLGLSGRLFAHAPEYRSDSENGAYAAAIVNALKNQRKFENFKRNLAYQKILEHVSKEQGKCYLDILKNRDDGLLVDAISSVLKSDSIGNPIKYNYEDVGFPLSPTTLRYIKVASDLMLLFGKNLEEVVEIGCGYGGQCLVNEKLLTYRRATLFDLPFVNELIKRYLGYTLMRGAYRTKTINEFLPHQPCDLVISNYAFSELPSALQKVYINKILAHAKSGYLTMNSGIGGDRDIGKLSLSELRALLPEFEIFEEEPLTSEFNYIIVWGHNNKNIENNFVRKRFM